MTDFRRAACAALVVLAACQPAGGAEAPPDFAIVPLPAAVEPGEGAFALTEETGFLVQADDPRVAGAAERLATSLRAETGLPLPVGDEVTGIVVRIDPAVQGGDEGYHLAIRAEGVDLSASGAAGLFYGLQTLRQLVDPVSRTIRAGIIDDQPRFAYRGAHLDVGRHFFPVGFVKQYIDAIAAYKLNTFHWHLTEDQGWRLQIQKYPKLTEVGSCRPETRVGHEGPDASFDGTPYCGFYTQDEAREIVEYARERFVTVIPEIELPGHSLAALASYPELACTEGPFTVGTRWGVYEDIYCPKEETFAFLQDVLTEVMEIFPSQYIHIGGDEAPKARWEESPVAQAIIQREGLADEHELQSWFVQRIERFLNANDRRIIGWDEILEGGVAPNATVMSWRGEAGGIAAARQGHDVVMSPNSYLYLDYYQADPEGEPLAIGGNLPLEKVYSYEPVPDSLTSEEAVHILGAQANLWTEYLKTPEAVEYMAFPRLLALSEVVWSPAEAKDFDGFVARLPNQLRLLKAAGIRYRHPVEQLGPEEAGL